MKKPLKLSLLILFSFTSSAIFCQTDWKNWNSLNVDFGLTKKLELGVSYLRGHNLSNPYVYEFSQTTGELSYAFSKHFSLGSGVILASSPSGIDDKTRTFLRGTYKTRIGKLTWSNALQGEMHQASEIKYHYRAIYITRLGLKKRLDFLNLSPSVSYWLYYNIGGSPIQYYDPLTKLRTIKETPDGLHRSRLTLNLNSKITDAFSVSAFYKIQREFNLGNRRQINVVNPRTGHVTRSFDDYNVVGLALDFQFDFYKKAPKKQNTKTITYGKAH